MTSSEPMTMLCSIGCCTSRCSSCRSASCSCVSLPSSSYSRHITCCCVASRFIRSCASCFSASWRSLRSTARRSSKVVKSSFAALFTGPRLRSSSIRRRASVWASSSARVQHAMGPSADGFTGGVRISRRSVCAAASLGPGFHFRGGGSFGKARPRSSRFAGTTSGPGPLGRFGPGPAVASWLLKSPLLRREACGCPSFFRIFACSSLTWVSSLLRSLLPVAVSSSSEGAEPETEGTGLRLRMFRSSCSCRSNICAAVMG
mmetsp:Transcript_32059/g.74886  ORF Transcript_32059/g.74886 Transcript_32059/m.74886 type:complete len:260 (-) Transcript_32059:40-819(-)